MKRYQVTAVPINGGERLTGYPNAAGDKRYIRPLDGLFDEFIEVDRTTIEPVKVSSKYSAGKALCVECSCALFRWHRFCPDCGLAIDWEENDG